MAIKFYPVESKLFGYQINLGNDNLYIAIPKKYFKKYSSIIAMNDGDSKEYTIKDIAGEATFKDKFKPTKNYTLYYLLWKSYDN
jgi:hypothetical protein